MMAAMDGCDRNTRDEGRAASSQKRLLTGTRGAAMDGCDGDKGDEGGAESSQKRLRRGQEGDGAKGQENQAWMTPWVIHIQTR